MNGDLPVLRHLLRLSKFFILGQSDKFLVSAQSRGAEEQVISLLVPCI
jgi:hypothetical protein